jgi:hypothetical protein
MRCGRDCYSNCTERRPVQEKIIMELKQNLCLIFSFFVFLVQWSTVAWNTLVSVTCSTSIMLARGPQLFVNAWTQLLWKLYKGSGKRNILERFFFYFSHRTSGCREWGQYHKVCFDKCLKF